MQLKNWILRDITSLRYLYMTLVNKRRVILYVRRKCFCNHKAGMQVLAKIQFHKLIINI